jgi:hypothetical protein
MTGFVLFVIAAAIIVAVGHLRYHEMDELRAGVKRTVGSRRIRVANNIRVRRAGRALSKAANLNELFEAVTEMLAFEEFAFAKVQLGRAGQADVNERAFRATEQGRPLPELEFNNGRIVWTWKQQGIEVDDVIGSSSYWCFRLPLSTDGCEWGWINLYRPLSGPPLLLDMNYLAGLLRVELSAAAERVLRPFEEPAAAGAVKLTMTAGKIAG